MVSSNTFIAASIVLVATALQVEAAVSPTYPQPGTIQVVGESNDITWTFDGKDDQTYQIDLMTGSNSNQTVLQTVATDVSASLLKYPFVAPAVDPYSAIYFFMFTGSKKDQAWTTRFGIVPDANTNLTKEAEATQPDGEAIPWGMGQLATNGTNTTSTAASSSDVSAAPVASLVDDASKAPSAIEDSGAAFASDTPPSANDSNAAPLSDTPVTETVVSDTPDAAAGADAEGTTTIPIVNAIAVDYTTSSAFSIKPALSLMAAGLAGYILF